ncbi:unnamed protein product, partial [Rotaria sp. Silwood1]
MFSSSIKLVTSNANITLENSIIKYTTILEANEEKILTYTFEITNRYIGLTIHTLSIHGLLDSFRKKPIASTSDLRVLANVKIYSNLAEIIQPLGKLPIEFSSDDWNNIRSDSVTLVGNNVTITQQTLTEKKKSLNNAQVYVRAPSSSNTETKFVKATMIDEKHNLVKIIDKDISKEPIFFTAQPDHIVYENEPPQTKYYVNFTYDTSDAVYLSYLR